MKKNDLMEILNGELKNKIYNEYKTNSPNLVNMNNKEWVKNPLIY